MGMLLWYLGIAVLAVFATWAVLLLLALAISAVCLRLRPAATDEGVEGIDTIENAVAICRGGGLRDWELVEFAQRLVARHMRTYGYWNAFDSPGRAFERRMGYCWQRAGALELILEQLGFRVEMVHTFVNRFPATTVEGTTIPEHTSGHVWLRVGLGNSVKDVCPGSEDNVPGKVHFRSITRVMPWGPGIFLICYLGVPVANVFSYAVLSLKRYLSTSGGP